MYCHMWQGKQQFEKLEPEDILQSFLEKLKTISLFTNDYSSN